jgi:hypothetical protein
MRFALAAVVMLLALAPRAGAAQPSAGSVANSDPALIWKGTASGSPFIWADILLAARDHPILCASPFCDTFVLHVVDSRDLRIESSSCADDVTAVEVEQPDGSRLFADGLEGSPRTIVDLIAAPAGTYRVRTLVNVLPDATGAYIGHATLTVPAARATLTARNRTVPDTRATSGDRVRIGLVATAPITSLRAVLRGAHRSIVGKARLAALDGRGSIVFTLSRTLRPGRYRVAITADDGAGAIHAAAVLRVSRGHHHARSSRHRRSRGRAEASAPAFC